MWPLRIASESVGEIFNPFYYVVDVKGNWWWSEDLESKVKTIEELEQVASAQRKLMREVASIAASMQANYIRVQTLLAERLLEDRDMKAPADLPGLQTDIVTSHVLRGDNEEKQSVQTGANAADHESGNMGKQCVRNHAPKVPLGGARGKLTPF